MPKIGVNRRIGRPYKKGEGGRPKGLPNKLTRTVRESYEAVYEGLGGVAGHIEYLKAHPKAMADFYAHVHPLLLPHDVNLGGTGKDGAILLHATWGNNGHGSEGNK